MKKIIQLLSLLVLLLLSTGCFCIRVDEAQLWRSASGIGGRYYAPSSVSHRHIEAGVGNHGRYYYDTGRNNQVERCDNNYHSGHSGWGYTPRGTTIPAPEVGGLLPSSTAEQNYWCAYCRGFYGYRHCH